MKTYQHQAVLLEEAVSSLKVRGDGFYLDATFGRGGHSRAIMGGLTEQGRLFTLDKDPQAVAAGLEEWGDDPRFSIVQGSFAEMDRMVQEWHTKGNLDGILLDLGVSSPQLDDPERGFSFMKEGPLDMRMDPTKGVSAAEWLAGSSEREMTRVFWEFGDRKSAMRAGSLGVSCKPDSRSVWKRPHSWQGLSKLRLVTGKKSIPQHDASRRSGFLSITSWVIWPPGWKHQSGSCAREGDWW